MDVIERLVVSHRNHGVSVCAGRINTPAGEETGTWVEHDGTVVGGEIPEDSVMDFADFVSWLVGRGVDVVNQRWPASY